MSPRAHGHIAAPAPAHPEAAHSPARKRSRKRGRKGTKSASTHHVVSETSLPTSRNAYVETRAWLLKHYGPVCAYCGVRFAAKVMTLDHVQPRRGQTAYDRRDNLVLACEGCNSMKRDQSPVAFLLGSRPRARNLLRYGAHLSPMLVELASSLAPATVYRDEADYEGESPYAD